MKPRKVIVIDTRNKTFRAAAVNDLKEMQAIVGGRIERAHILPNGDEVYVNEEGTFEENPPLFYIHKAHQPFCGDAYVIGPVNGRGDNTDVQSQVEDIKELTSFMGRI